MSWKESDLEVDANQSRPTRFFSAEAVSRPSNLVQVYISRSTDPYLNLSIEHFLLRRSHADSVVLLLYTNRPCVVIGRNQNPWVEVNLGLRKDVTNDDDDVLLVRRRSGGGTVFHDAGNVNYSVICPPAAFDRDKHAEMVVRALRRLTKTLPHAAVRVNERHDIVLDIPQSASSSSPSSSSPADVNTSSTGMEEDANAATNPADANNIRTFKISGSAYKLTRTRSLHHGTCLLCSPHLPFLGRLLRSPAAPYIKARGVESVRSPVRNVGGGISTAAFEDAVVEEFLSMYQSQTKPHSQSQTQSQSQARAQIITLDAASAAGSIPEVIAGVAELRSGDWIYAQTPQFVFSSHPTADDPRPRPDLPADLPSSAATAAAGGDSDGDGLVSSLKGLHLHHVDDWRARVGSGNESVGRWLNRLFGVGG
ncbi:hypothetical protein F5X97DRAFT_335675 [Nemania serpens]|nr:hypothetical protein F5X97DRAFT_335675 [Nemania serpens]